MQKKISFQTTSVPTSSISRGMNLSLFAGGRLAGGLFAAVLPLMTLASDARADALVDALSHDRHGVPSFSELATIAGGRDALIARLIELRGDNTVPMLGMRSTKLLLENFNGEPAIAAAFEEDLGRPDRKGIAQAIALNLDRVPNPAARMKLAQGVLQKAKADTEYATYAKSLIASKDQAVSSLAKTNLQ